MRAYKPKGKSPFCARSCFFLLEVFRRGGKLYPKTTALPLFRLHAELELVPIERRFYDGKPQPRTLNGAFVQFGRAVIPFPNVGKFLLRDPLARIAHFEENAFFRLRKAHENVFILARVVDGVSDQIILISYFAKQMERARELLPEIAVGDLNFMPKSASLEKIVKDAAKRGVTFSPVWSEVNAEIGYELFMRGFGMGCWTYRTAAELANGYASCWHSLTVNDASLSSDFIEGAEGALALYSNRAVQPKISAVTLADGKAEKEVKIISADFEYSLSENGIMAAANGTYTATVSISFSGCGKNLYIFEQVPVTVASYSEETAPPETPDLPQEPKYPGDQNGGGETSNGEKASENNLGLVIGLSVAAGVIAVAGVACGVTLALCKRKK